MDKVEQKAKEIIESFDIMIKGDLKERKLNTVKNCSVVLCNQMISAVVKYFDTSYPDFDFWVRVRATIYKASYDENGNLTFKQSNANF